MNISVYILLIILYIISSVKKYINSFLNSNFYKFINLIKKNYFYSIYFVFSYQIKIFKKNINLYLKLSIYINNI